MVLFPAVTCAPQKAGCVLGDGGHMTLLQSAPCGVVHQVRKHLSRVPSARTCERILPCVRSATRMALRLALEVEGHLLVVVPPTAPDKSLPLQLCNDRVFAGRTLGSGPGHTVAP